MNQKYFILLIFFCFHLNIFAQKHYTEAGLFFGVSNYHGDLTPHIMEVNEYNMAFGAFGRYNFNGHFGIKFHFYKGTLSGTDFNAQVLEGDRERNLSFRSDLLELGAQFEYNFLNFQVSKNDHITTPYIFAGIAGFHFNPQAEYNGQWFNLQELGTEGQGLEGYAEPYNLLSFAIPVGVGVKFNINHLTNIGLEFGVRTTFTDYLDDVSTVYPDLEALGNINGQFATALSYRTGEYDPNLVVADPAGTPRGNPEINDFYFFGGIMLSVNIGKKNGFKDRQKQPTKRQKRAPKMEF